VVGFAPEQPRGVPISVQETTSTGGREKELTPASGSIDPTLMSFGPAPGGSPLASSLGAASPSKPSKDEIRKLKKDPEKYLQYLASQHQQKAAAKAVAVELPLANPNEQWRREREQAWLKPTPASPEAKASAPARSRGRSRQSSVPTPQQPQQPLQHAAGGGGVKSQQTYQSLASGRPSTATVRSSSIKPVQRVHKRGYRSQSVVGRGSAGEDELRDTVSSLQIATSAVGSRHRANSSTRKSWSQPTPLEIDEMRALMEAQFSQSQSGEPVKRQRTRFHGPPLPKSGEGSSEENKEQVYTRRSASMSLPQSSNIYGSPHSATSASDIGSEDESSSSQPNSQRRRRKTWQHQDVAIKHDDGATVILSPREEHLRPRSASVVRSQDAHVSHVQRVLDFDSVRAVASPIPSVAAAKHSSSGSLASKRRSISPPQTARYVPTPTAHFVLPSLPALPLSPPSEGEAQRGARATAGAQTTRALPKTPLRPNNSTQNGAAPSPLSSSSASRPASTKSSVAASIFGVQPSAPARPPPAKPTVSSPSSLSSSPANSQSARDAWSSAATKLGAQNGWRRIDNEVDCATPIFDVDLREKTPPKPAQAAVKPAAKPAAEPKRSESPDEQPACAIM
jgi:hypothetical protein